MMNKLLLLCLISFSVVAQNRISIKGKVIVPKNEQASLIEVLNSTTGYGTITNADGTFKLAVGLDDKIEFKAVQYQDFSVIVDRGIMTSKQMIITINVGVNELEEVVVTPYDLNGNIEVDLEKINLVDVNPRLSDTREIMQSYEANNPNYVPITVQESPTEVRFIKNGLNVANMFRAIFKEDLASKQPKTRTQKQLRGIFQDEFFKQQLNINLENINAFINFVENNGLTENLLKKDNELDLIRFLLVKAEQFKKG